MKNLLNYLYSINIDKVKEFNTGYIIKDLNNNLYLLNNVDNKSNINSVINILIGNRLKVKHYLYRFNIYNQVLTYVDGKYYTLVKLDSDYNEEIDFVDMLTFYNSVNINNLKINYVLWEEKWENKINYFLNQDLNNQVKDKKIIIYFWYYIGVAENSLLYLKNINNNFKTGGHNGFCFTHRRISFPCKKIDFYNPNDFYIDIKERDIAEYIKSLFYNNEDYLTELDYYFKTNILSNYDASMLYARIVYPSVFFDYYESRDESFNYPLLFDPDKFEIFIKKTYELINSYVQINKIDWL